MLSIDIPGYKKIEARHLVLDFNGTLAIDGKFIKGTRPLLEALRSRAISKLLFIDRRICCTPYGAPGIPISFIPLLSFFASYGRRWRDPDIPIFMIIPANQTPSGSQSNRKNS